MAYSKNYMGQATHHTKEKGEGMTIAAEQLEHELHKLIDRYTVESDLRIMDLIAVLEKVKLDCVHVYHVHHDNKNNQS